MDKSNRHPKKLLSVLNGKKEHVPPVWLMRQAGRYLPEYREVRAKAGGFLNLCYTPEYAIEVTLQPIRRYGFDAAIIFADILLIPQALGQNVRFATGEGPLLDPVTSQDDLKRLKLDRIHEVLSPVYETVSGVRSKLPKDTTLIGFAGSPWTVATYMVAGKGTSDQAPAREWMYRDSDGFQKLIDLVTEATIEYLSRQVEAGAEVIKLFDSWAGTLAPRAFEKYCLAPNRRIIEELRKKFPGLCFIGFPRGVGSKSLDFVKETQVEAIAIDTSFDPRWARDYLQPLTAIQGNLDPMLMVTGGQALDREVKILLEILAGGRYIFNLGHGITPQADPRHVDQLLKIIRG